jgi:hypothetical protein
MRYFSGVLAGTLVVDPADQLGQLCRQLGGLVHHQPIANRVQVRTQDPVCGLVIVGPKLLR